MALKNISLKNLWGVLFFLIVFQVTGQEIYIGDDEKIIVLDLETCESREIYVGPFTGARESLFFDLAFHPNGKLYVTTYFDIVELDPRTWQPKVLQSWTQNPQAQYMSMAINEKGDFIIGGVDGHRYDWRNNRFEAHYPRGGVEINPFGFFNGRLLDLITNRQMFSTSTLDPFEPRDTFWNFTDTEYEYYYATKSHTPCGGTLFIGQAYHVDENETQDHFLIFDESARTIEEVCYTSDGSAVQNRGLSATDNFRDNGMLLNLDSDHSSFHRTGGFYDSLTVCDPAGRLTDHDISIRMCGKTMDSIVFESMYFSEPSLNNEELITSENGLDPAGPGRWIWNIPAGTDTSQIADFLRTIRYTAEWPEEESHERIIVTTAWAGGESTSSWTVFQLIGTDELAGRDSTLSYCMGRDLINLAHYLSPGVDSRDGYFEPEPSGGRTLFLPGEDPDGEYLFIVDKYGCPDTAVITVLGSEGEKQRDTLAYCEESDPILLTEVFPGTDGRTEPLLTGGGLEFNPRTDEPGVYRYIIGDGVCSDTIEILFELNKIYPPEIPDVVLCSRGGSKRIGVPAETYDEVEWWNGETKDSITLYAEDLISSSVWVRVSSGICTEVIPVKVQMIPGEVTFPSWVSDTVWLSHSDENFRIISGMDYLLIDGKDRYSPEDDIYLEEGLHVLTGFFKGCETEKEIWVVLTEPAPCEVSLPNVIVPNGENHTLRVYSTCEIRVQEIRIFDKWGGQRYIGHEEEVGSEVWAGLPPDVYLVEVTYEQTGKGVLKITEAVLVVR